MNCVFQSIEENTPFTGMIDNLMLTFKRRLLNIEIRIAFWKIDRLNKENTEIKNRSVCLANSSLATFFSSQEKSFDKQYTNNISGLNSKFDALSRNQLTNHIQSDTEKFIHNASNTPIPDDVKFMTGLGPKFGLPIESKEIPVFGIVCDLEMILNNCVEAREQNNIRYTATNVLKRAVNNRNLTSFESFLIKKKQTTSKFFKEHTNIICMRSDKGGKTVFMDRNVYDEEAVAMLNDRATYQPCKDPTKKLQRLNNAFVQKLYDSGKIETATNYKLKSQNPSPPLMYFLAKHHKKDMPLRPISADLNGPTRNLSEFASKILSKLTKSEYHIKNSYEFQQFISNCTFDEEEEMVSFDVVSLFTNAPVPMIIEIIELRWNEIEQHTNLSKSEFLEMITLCTTNSYFAYKDKTYKQSYGTPMGAPISPILVELLMDFILDKIQVLMESQSRRIRVLKKYVNDLFLLVRKGKVNEILELFNSVDDRIQFTYELEKDKRIPFLDMMVHRDDTENFFYTNWYRKPVSSGRMLNYHSVHPMNQKISTALGLIDRVHRLSDDRFKTNNKSLLKDLLIRNDYPVRLINRLIDRYYQRSNSTVPNVTNSTRTNVEIKRFSLPYVPGVSQSIAKSITNVCDNVSVAYKNNNNVGKFFSKLKDPIPFCESRNIVYQVNCIDCNNQKCYIGTTGQTVHKRMNQHKNDVNKNNPNRSALAHHAIHNNHKFDFENVRILERESIYNKRMLLEELHIKSSRNCVNFKSQETRNVNDIYMPLLENIGKNS